MKVTELWGMLKPFVMAAIQNAGQASASSSVGSVPNHAHLGVSGDGGQVDHGAALTPTSLLDDDHTQYLNVARHLAIGDGSPHHAAVTLADAATLAILSLSTQALTFDNQAANTVLAGPVAGGAAQPTFRAAVKNDLPAAVAYEDEANTFALAQTINVNSATALLVEQNGVFDDVLVVDTATGVVGIGTAVTTFIKAADTWDATLMIVGDPADSSSEDLVLKREKTGLLPRMGFLCARTGPGAVADNDLIGGIMFRAHDGTDYNDAAGVFAEIDGAVGANTVPTELGFYTTTTNSATKRMSISPAGAVWMEYLTADSLVYANGSKLLTSIVSVASGRPLISNGAGTPPIYAGWYLAGTAGQTYTFPPATASIPGGSGAANQIAYWSAANTLAGDAGLLVDAANDMYIVADAGGFGNAIGTARLMFDSSGATDYAHFEGCNVGIGKPAPAARLEIAVEDGTTSTLVLYRYFDSTAGGSFVSGHARGTLAIPASVQTADIVGGLTANAYTSSFVAAGQLRWLVENIAGTVLSTYVALSVRNAGTLTEAWRVVSTGYFGVGAVAPASRIESEETKTLAASPTDDYAAALTLDPGYSGAYTVTRHNYIDVQNVSVASGAAVTDAAVMRFDANIGTHKALSAAFQTTDSNGDTTDWAGGIKVNVNGTLYKVPLIAA
jgi:hypothetical protein